MGGAMIDNKRYPVTNPYGVTGSLQQTRHEVNLRWRCVWAVVASDGQWATSAWWSTRRAARTILRDLRKEGWDVP